MTKIGLGRRGRPRRTPGRSARRAKAVGFPVIRPSFTLGGTGGGIAYNHEEFVTICKTAWSCRRPTSC